MGGQSTMKSSASAAELLAMSFITCVRDESRLLAFLGLDSVMAG
jgi:hypothetical protein